MPGRWRSSANHSPAKWMKTSVLMSLEVLNQD